VLYSQPRDSVTFSHVSQIKAEASNNLIKITWVDSPDARGPVYIFRSTLPFDGIIPPYSRPVIINYGVREYIDDIDNMEIVHYFVAASYIDGHPLDSIIPNVNSISINLTELTVWEGISPETGPLPLISNLRARMENDKVIISWVLSGDSGNIILYRSMQPVRNPQDLLNAVIVSSGINTTFTDNPVQGISWYYAAVCEDDISGGNVEIRPGSNATVNPVVISGRDGAEHVLRSIPLPYMTVHNTMPESDFFWRIPERAPLGDETVKALENSQLQPVPSITKKTPRIFVIDLEPPASGEESALNQILRDYFEKHDWENARTSLLYYLSLPRSRDVQARARFYLGQTHYFTGNYREALFEFLSIQGLHPVEAHEWINAVLAAMVN
jgi:hypothetical protein